MTEGESSSEERARLYHEFAAKLEQAPEGASAVEFEALLRLKDSVDARVAAETAILGRAIQEAKSVVTRERDWLIENANKLIEKYKGLIKECREAGDEENAAKIAQMLDDITTKRDSLLRQLGHDAEDD